MKTRISTNHLPTPTILALCAVLGGALQSYAQPATLAPTPTAPQGHAISLWNSTGAYTNVPVDNYYEVWYGSTPGTYTIPSTTNSVLDELGMLCCAAIEMQNNPINISGCTNLHVDVFTPNGNNLDLRLVDSTGAQADMVYAAAGGAITNNGWISLDIPLSTFTGLRLSSIKQLGWIDNTAGANTPADYYFDNIYFSAATNLVYTPPPPIPVPTNNAPTPTRSADSVMAMYDSSGTYPLWSGSGGLNWDANWSGSSESSFTITNSPGSTVMYLPGLSYVGVEFYDPNQIDTTGFSTLHFDVWTLNANQIGVQLVSLSPTVVAQVYVPLSVTNQWVGVDIPLSEFESANAAVVMNNLQQLLWVDNGGSGTEGGTFYIDNVYFYSNAVVSPTVINYPTNNAPTPTRPASSVLSMYNGSGNYSDVSIYDWLATWSSASETSFTITNTSNDVLRYSALQFAGVEFPSLDTTGFSALHFDLWTPNANQFGIQLVSLNPTKAAQINFTNGSGTITTNQWISIDIPLSQFAAANAAVDLTSLQQLLWIDNQSGGSVSGTFYIDNVYFWTTNGINSSIALGNQISWTAQSADTYQPQRSVNGSTWSNLGRQITGSTLNSVFDGSPVSYYRVIQQGGANLIADPGFETAAVNALGAANWNALAESPASQISTWATNQYGALSAHNAAKMLYIESTTPATGSVTAPSVDVRSDLTPVTPGTAYTLSFYAANPVQVGGANPQYDVFYYDSNKNVVGAPAYTSFSSVGSSWTLVSTTITPPAGATQLTVGWIQALGAGNGWDWVTLIDDVSLSTGTVTNTLTPTVQSGVGITWQSSPGLTYTVQSTPSLVNQNWSAVGANVIGAGTNTVSDAASSGQKFYRVLEDY